MDSSTATSAWVSDQLRTERSLSLSRCARLLLHCSAISRQIGAIENEKFPALLFLFSSFTQLLNHSILNHSTKAFVAACSHNRLQRGSGRSDRLVKKAHLNPHPSRDAEVKGNGVNGLRRVDGKKSSDEEENFAPVEIEIAHAGTSIPAGEYRAYCRHARTYFDGGFKRWTCLLDFDVFSDRLVLIAKLPLWFNLGAGKKPRVTRRSNYLAAWIKANGGPPRRVDRLTARVFLRRMCRVTVASTAGAFPRSVVREIVEWQTGQSSALASVEGSFQPKTTQPAGAVLNAPAKACSIGGISE